MIKQNVYFPLKYRQPNLSILVVIAIIQMAVNITPPPGGTPLYKLYRYVPPHRVVVRRFGLKTGTNFAHFGSGIGYGFRGNYGSDERIYRFNFK